MDRKNGRISLSILQAIAVVLVVAVVGAAAGYGVLWYTNPLIGGEQGETAEDIIRTDNFGRFVQAVHNARTLHISEPTVEEMVKGAINGALGATGDPYSVYYDRSGFENLQLDLSGEYGGIGVQVREISLEGETYVEVVSPFAETPGATTPYEDSDGGDSTGLRPGDRIVAVDGDDIVGLDVGAAADLMRGEPGTEVTLTVERPESDDSPLTFHITRAQITIPTVESRMLTDDIGYLHLLQFNAQSQDQVQQALAELRGQGMEGLVLDLRFNPGGVLTTVEEIADVFLESGVIVEIESRADGDSITRASPGSLDEPFVVLVDGATASASEILTGAIQDHNAATVVGTRTFGKGVVQQVFRFDENTGAKITTAEFFTPDGRPIQDEGLAPDVEVELEEDAQLSVLDAEVPDNQLQRAMEILRQDMEGGS